MIQYGDSTVYDSIIGNRHLKYPGKLRMYQVAPPHEQAQHAGYGGGGGVVARYQGLTLVHFSAQSKPCLPQKHTLNTPWQPLTSPY